MTGPIEPREPYRRVNVPSYVVYCITLVFVSVLICFVVLSVTESDATEFRAWLNTVLNFGGIVLGGGGLAFAASADRKAGKAAEQTNGGLDARVRDIIRTENVRQSGDVSGEYSQGTEEWTP